MAAHERPPGRAREERGADAADKQAKAEIDKYVADKKMASGTIVDRRYNLLPECCEYTVKSPPASAASGGPQGRSCTPCRAVPRRAV